MSRSPGTAAGFSLLQGLLFLALVTVAAAVLLPLGSQLLSIERSSRTESQLRRIRQGLMGDREIGAERARSDFGYLGDFGTLPDSLPQLGRPLGLPAFSVSAGRRLGAGWRGPYLPVPTLRDTVEWRRDAFGRPIRYETADSLVGGDTWDAFLQSAGSDGDLTTPDDNITVPVLRSETRGDVAGVAVDATGDPAADTPVTLTYRRDGALVDTTVATDGSGAFAFAGIPFGRVMVRLGQGAGGSGGPGEIQYVPGSAVYQGGAEREVEFAVRNTGSTGIEITSWTATYDRSAFYERIKIATPDDAGEGKTVFEATGTWPGSGDPVTFDTPDTIPPPSSAATSPSSDHSVTLALAGPAVSVDTLRLLDAGAGGGAANTVIRIEEFRGNSSGGGPPVDMSGASFTIDFSDGSTVSFTIPP